jgi:nucleoside-diphosphate-sugar epimerase
MSDRLRLDLVLNDFVACAVTSGEITVLSDGTPWRPLIDVEDMARAISWAIVRSPARARYLARDSLGQLPHRVIAFVAARVHREQLASVLG